MATNSGSGSVLFKILILLFAIVLILVIKIPDNIWSEEENEKNQAQFNMSSIYEAEKQYHRLTNKYTTDKNLLLQELRKDSSLIKNEKLVIYTQKLKNAITKYLSNDLINNLLTTKQIIQTITEDLVNGERYFRSDQDILNTGDELRLKLSGFSSELTYPNYSQCVSYLDSLNQLKLDISDYTLQTAASRASQLAENANKFIGNIEVYNFVKDWNSIATGLENFRVTLKNSEINKNTNVGPRLKDFLIKIEPVVLKLSTINVGAESKNAIEISSNISDIYNTFLKDYIITSKHGQLSLSPEDSMVLYIMEDNFRSPVSGEEYLILLNEDSSDVKVESPLLVNDLMEYLNPIANEIAELDFLPKFKAYSDSLDSLYSKALYIRSKMRRNLEITVKNKEIQETINKYKAGSENSAAMDLINFIEAVKNSRSYSTLKENIENARNAIGIFEQVYGENIFSNIDSINTDITSDLEEYNEILSSVRRLPRDIEMFDSEAQELDQLLNNIKQKTASTSIENLNSIKESLEQVLLFASEGKSVRVFGIFEKKHENFGYVYRNSKSWEEEE